MKKIIGFMLVFIMVFPFFLETFTYAYENNKIENIEKINNSNTENIWEEKTTNNQENKNNILENNKTNNNENKIDKDEKENNENHHFLPGRDSCMHDALAEHQNKDAKANQRARQSHAGHDSHHKAEGRNVPVKNAERHQQAKTNIDLFHHRRFLGIGFFPEDIRNNAGVQRADTARGSNHCGEDSQQHEIFGKRTSQRLQRQRSLQRTGNCHARRVEYSCRRNIDAQIPDEEHQARYQRIHHNQLQVLFFGQSAVPDPVRLQNKRHASAGTANHAGKCNCFVRACRHRGDHSPQTSNEVGTRDNAVNQKQRC